MFSIEFESPSVTAGTPAVRRRLRRPTADAFVLIYPAEAIWAKELISKLPSYVRYSSVRRDAHVLDSFRCPGITDMFVDVTVSAETFVLLRQESQDTSRPICIIGVQGNGASGDADDLACKQLIDFAITIPIPDAVIAALGRRGRPWAHCSRQGTVVIVSLDPVIAEHYQTILPESLQLVVTTDLSVVSTACKKDTVDAIFVDLALPRQLIAKVAMRWEQGNKRARFVGLYTPSSIGTQFTEQLWFERIVETTVEAETFRRYALLPRQ